MSKYTRRAAVLISVDADGSKGMCTLETWSELSSTGRRFTRCRIIDDPPELPDGTYRLEFDGHRVITNKALGRWELSFLSLSEDHLKRQGAA